MYVLYVCIRNIVINDVSYMFVIVVTIFLEAGWNTMLPAYHVMVHYTSEACMYLCVIVICM